MTNQPKMAQSIEQLNHAVSEIDLGILRLGDLETGNGIGDSYDPTFVALRGIRDARDHIDIAVTLAVLALRASDKPPSWAVIGEALGMSRQAAWEKYEAGPLHTDVV